jgi:hypothetical protein
MAFALPPTKPFQVNRMSFLRPVSLPRLSFFAAVCGVSVALTGCGLNSGGVTPNPIGAGGLGAMSGSVHGGLQPVVGALVQLYEVGATGYGTAAKPIVTGTVLTNASGGFSISGGYTCDPGSYVYLTAAGGNPGSGTNSNLALMAALGSCSKLLANGATTSVWINEVTTVAAAYALGQFSTGTSFGTTLASKPGSAGVTPPADNFATSATNVQGVANAMGIANVLANSVTGTSPGANSNGSATVENYTINTIADILSTCVNSAGGTAGDGSACGNVFAATTPTGGVAPADTIQAALEFALHPGDANLLAGTPSGSTLDGLIVAQPPYQPYVNTTILGNTISDWTVAVSYNPVTPNTSTTLISGSNQVAIDGFGNAWVTSLANKSVVELAPNGDPIQAGSTGLYSVTNYSQGGTSTTIAGGGSTSGAIFGMAIDNSNNAWISDYGSGYIFKVGASGASFGVNGEIATSNGGGGTAATSLYTGAAGAHPVGIAFDASNNLFSALYGNGGASPAGGTGCGSYTTGTKNIVTFPYSSGSATYGALVFGSPGGSNQTFIAIDGGATDTTGGTTIPGAPFVWTIGEASGSGEVHPAGGTNGHYGLLFPAYTGSTGASPQGCQTALGSITSAGYTGTATTKVAQNANGGDTTDLFNNAFSVAFDANNNLWTANQLPTDLNGTYLNSFTRLTPNYGAALTSANFIAATTYQTFATGGMSSSGFKAFALAIDGASNVYASNNSTKPVVAAVTNAGVGLAPATTGFTGATYSATGATEVARPISTSPSIAVDLSGNLWVASAAATLAVVGPPAVTSVPATNVVQIVGAAVPVLTPIAAGVKANSLGAKP